MPLVSQGGNVTLSLLVRNGAGNPSDPINLSLTIEDSLGAALSGFPKTIPPIVQDAVGQFHYVWAVGGAQALGSYRAVWEGLIDGVPSESVETVDVVAPGSMVSTGFDILLSPDDYDAVRALLGVTEVDVIDETIELPTFGLQAESLVKRRISNWETQIADPDLLFPLRIAATYATAALMAESYVRGGTVGFVRPLSTGEGRDWAIAAEHFWSKYNYWLSIADDSDTDSEDDSYFLVDPLRKGGPTRYRKTRGLALGTYIPWWRDPDQPIYGPDWPVIPQ